MIGTSLDKYDVLQKVGEGGMATVYRGRHSTLNRDVAIKVLHPHLSSSTRNRKRFAREARAIEHLRHDNILEIFDYSGATAAECYIVTEFVSGETLTEVIDRVGNLPSEVAALVGLSLARALDYAHGAGVLHRDLKPDNVMVRQDGTVKLMDFGIARFLDESQVTMTGALVGSPAFMSPEQAREATLDPRSDLFSLGTLLYFLVTGSLPFTGSNPSLILKNIIEGNRLHVTELTPGMSASLADLIESLLQTDPGDRPASAALVTPQLLEILAETGVDPDEPRWSLAAFLDDHETYRRGLEGHLLIVLLERGRIELDNGNHLGALRLFNRLLSLDDDNTEVMALVQGLHGEPDRRRRPIAAGFLAVAGLIVVVAAAATVWLWPGGATPPAGDVQAARDGRPPIEVPEPVVVAAPVVEVPVSDGEDDDDDDTDAVAAIRTGRSTPAARLATSVAAARSPGSPASVAPTAADTDTDDEAGTSDELDPLTRPGLGRLNVRLETGWAEIWIGGQDTGHTTSMKDLLVWPAGRYTVELRSAYTKTWTREVEISTNEVTDILDVALEYHPYRIRIDDSWSGGCEVRTNGKPAGLVADYADRVLEVPKQAGDSLVVTLHCGDGAPAKIDTDLPGVEVRFPPREGTARAP